MRRVDQIEPFRVMQLLERARTLEAQGRDIVHLEIGEPDLPPPPQAARAAIRAIQGGDGGYTPSAGLPALRAAIAAWYGRHHGVDVDPGRVLVTPGASGAFMVLYLAMLEAGERVLLPDPGYPCQRHFVRLAGGEPVCVPVGPGTAYHLDAAALEAHWTPSSRAALVTSPGNPTGTLIAPDALADLAAACRARGGWLISDEIYHGLVYGRDGRGNPRKAVSALEVDRGAVVVNGFSKRWAMTGYRVGWMVVPEALADPCERIMQNIFIAAATHAQHAALAALDADDHLAAMSARYDARRRLLLGALPALGFTVPVAPEGALYVYADAAAVTADAEAWCRTLLEEAGVAVTPGADFGAFRAATHVRFSYATSRGRIAEGVRRMAAFLGVADPLSGPRGG